MFEITCSDIIDIFLEIANDMLQLNISLAHSHSPSIHSIGVTAVYSISSPNALIYSTMPQDALTCNTNPH